MEKFYSICKQQRIYLSMMTHSVIWQTTANPFTTAGSVLIYIITRTKVLPIVQWGRHIFNRQHIATLIM